MKKAFLGGSRRIVRLNPEVRRQLDKIMHGGFQVLIGDANGADKAMQAYFAESGYQAVTVFCTGGECRNNLGNWLVHATRAPHRTRDFAYYTAKDAEMAKEADLGLMLWDGESAGTMVNAARLVLTQKPVVVYLAPERKFRTVRVQDELEQLLPVSNPGLRKKLERYINEFLRELKTPTQIVVQPQLFRTGYQSAY